CRTSWRLVRQVERGRFAGWARDERRGGDLCAAVRAADRQPVPLVDHDHIHRSVIDLVVDPGLLPFGATVAAPVAPPGGRHNRRTTPRHVWLQALRTKGTPGWGSPWHWAGMGPAFIR